MNSTGRAVLFDFCLIGHDGEIISQCVAAVVDIGDVLTFHLFKKVKRQQRKSHTFRNKLKLYYYESNLSMCEGCDGHSWDPVVLQVSVSRWNNELIQEVHVGEVMTGNLDDVRGQRQG